MKLDKGIPMPEIKAGRPRKYEWNQMDVGDSIFVEGLETGRAALLNAQSWAKVNLAVEVRCADGTIIPSPGGLGWKEQWERDEEIEKVHGKSDTSIVGRRTFAGRKMEGGYRIWRVENVRFTEDEMHQPIPGTKIRFLKD